MRSRPADAEYTLPADHDAERYVLALALRHPEDYSEIARRICLDDLSLTRHKRILLRMGDLYVRKLPIDITTLAKELEQHRELGKDGLGYLADLDGIPAIRGNLDGYIRVLHQKHALREAIFIGDNLIQSASAANGNTPDVIAKVRVMLERFVEQQAEDADDAGGIQSIDDLESVFADQTPIKYLIEPELPERAVVYLAGDSESGKSTLACAWARDLVRVGHAALILDRDKNPRKVIRDRFLRLGMTDSPRLRIWDVQQADEAPQPDAPIVVEWVPRMITETGRPPVVIIDSLISFLRDGESENDSRAMRTLYDRCKVLTRLGATVILIHHVGHNGRARGSSDFKPAGDQGFIVTNSNSDGSRLLSKIKLEADKSRYVTEDIMYDYADGKMQRIGNKLEVTRTVTEQLRALLALNPGISKTGFYELAISHKLSERAARNFVEVAARVKHSETPSMGVY
jgi:KaiC/GvpD/RAD55 family RecA-like ATPase